MLQRSCCAVLLAVALAGCSQSEPAADPHGSSGPEGVTQVTFEVPGMS